MPTHHDTVINKPEHNVSIKNPASVGEWNVENIFRGKFFFSFESLPDDMTGDHPLATPNPAVWTCSGQTVGQEIRSEPSAGRWEEASCHVIW